MMINESRRSRAHFDIPLTILVFGLAAFGVLSVSVATFNTSSPVEDTLLNYIVASYYGMRQAIFFLISPIIIGVITFSPTSSSGDGPRFSTMWLSAYCWWPWAPARPRV